MKRERLMIYTAALVIVPIFATGCSEVHLRKADGILHAAGKIVEAGHGVVNAASAITEVVRSDQTDEVAPYRDAGYEAELYGAYAEPFPEPTEFQGYPHPMNERY